MVFALAGRRIDAADAAVPRFPLRNAEIVARRLRALFEFHRPEALVCSAACGADLIALAEARPLLIRRRVILPFPRERFRLTSVTDRPGGWGILYDRTIDEVSAGKDLVVLAVPSEEAAAYRAAGHAILDESEALARAAAGQAFAVLVWEGKRRGAEDFTADFADDAARRGLPLLTVNTLDDVD